MSIYKSNKFIFAATLLFCLTPLHGAADGEERKEGSIMVRFSDEEIAESAASRYDLLDLELSYCHDRRNSQIPCKRSASLLTTLS